MYNIGHEFKKVRLSQKKTQREVAEGINVSEQAYQKYEYGKVIPSAMVLIALADYFDVSLDYLVGRSDDPTRR